MRRVVVTGLGLVTPLACGVEESWSRLLASKSGAGKLEGFSVEYYPTGKVHTRAQFKAGKLEGEFVEFAEDGKVMQRIYYKGGKRQQPPPSGR